MKIKDYDSNVLCYFTFSYVGQWADIQKIEKVKKMTEKNYKQY